MTIALDGVDHSGKSSLGRFLAWQLGMPVIETDFMLVEGRDSVSHDSELLKRLVEVRHKMDRPVIVEGVFVLRALKQAAIEPELLIKVKSATVPRSGSWPADFEKYGAEFLRTNSTDYRFTW